MTSEDRMASGSTVLVVSCRERHQEGPGEQALRLRQRGRPLFKCALCRAVIFRATAMADSWSSLLGPVFTAQVAESGGVTVLRLAGEFDLAAAADLGQVLSTACSVSVGRLVVDMSRVTFMDAAGLELLLRAHNHLLQQGRPGLSVWGAVRIVRRVFEITQTTSLLDEREPTFVRGGRLPELSDQGPALDLARREAGVSVKDLFVGYFALGGTADLGELVAHLGGGAGVLDIHQQDVAIQAMNEQLVELGRADRVLAFASDEP